MRREDGQRTEKFGEISFSKINIDQSQVSIEDIDSGNPRVDLDEDQRTTRRSSTLLPDLFVTEARRTEHTDMVNSPLREAAVILIRARRLWHLFRTTLYRVYSICVTSRVVARLEGA